MADRKSDQELDREKEEAARIASRWVTDGIHLGLGSGSTAAYFIKHVGQRIRNEGLRVTCVVTSKASQKLAEAEGITVIEPARGLTIDLTVDGADEMDSSLNLTKGGGGALLREKVIASASRYLLIIADSSKPVTKLGKFPLAVEVIPFAAPFVMDRIEDIGGNPVLRSEKNLPGAYSRTDQSNFILDCHFNEIANPAELSRRLHDIPGVVEHGLFINLARAAVVADGDKAVVMLPGRASEPAEHFHSLPNVM